MATPREAGFFMPPEWAPHAGCWMAWPCRPENWDDIETARATYVDVARAVARFEPVTMTANAEDDGRCGGRSAASPDVDVVVVPSDDSWARDTAPTFVVDGRGGLAGVDWRFNAYGGIYEEYAPHARTWRGGSSTCSGRDASPRPSSSRAARCTRTARARCSPPRRSCWTRAAIPGCNVRRPSGCCASTSAPRSVIWLTAALDHDNTGGHVDNLACFTAPGVVAALGCADRDDPQYERDPGEPGAPARGERRRRPRAGGRRAAHADAPGVRRAPALAQLRQLLRRQRRRRDARLR